VSGWWASIRRALPLAPGSATAWKWSPLCLHAIAAGALALRLAFAWRSEHLVHPDEVFQYLEQAHRLVYGYGFIPWEYRFARRNWLLPGTLAGLLEALRLLGFDRPATYIPALKALFAILSVSLVYAANALGRNLFGVRAGLIAAVLAAFWYELVEASTRATPEVLATYALVVALAFATGPNSARRSATVGLLLGIGVALRLQYAPCAAAVWVVCAIGWGWRPALVVVAAAAVMPAVAGALDLVTWGAPFASYYNSIVLDVVYRVSEMFGTAPWFYYADGLWIASRGVFAGAVAYGVLTWRKSWPLLLVLVALLVPHALIAHKEYRFIFLAVPLLLVLAAAAIAAAEQWLRARRVAPTARALATAAAFAIIAAVSIAGFRNYGVFRQDDRLLAALDLAQRSDVAAVLDLATPWYLCGGFYYLHHDVPVYFKPQLDALPGVEPRQLASHVLVDASAPDLPGFRQLAAHGTVRILEQVSPPAVYLTPGTDGREPMQGGVDDRFGPSGRPRL
jgi:phosphatidylinositol glycan class B